jgi:anti-anti-sigma factor
MTSKGYIMTTSPRFGEPTIEVRWLGSETALVLLGGEHDLSTAPGLVHTLQSLGDCTHLIVDLTATEFIDSSTIAALLKAKKRADQGDRKFNLVMGTADIVERALATTQVLPALNHVRTIDQALTPETDRSRTTIRSPGPRPPA